MDCKSQDAFTNDSENGFRMWSLNKDMTYQWKIAIPSFRLRDNSVHLHECSPFCVFFFHSILERKLICLLFDVNMRILIALFHVKRKTDIMLTWTYIIVIEILAKTQFSNILLNTHYGYTSQQGTNSYKPKILKRE